MTKNKQTVICICLEDNKCSNTEKLYNAIMDKAEQYKVTEISNDDNYIYFECNMSFEAWLVYNLIQYKYIEMADIEKGF